MNSMIKHAIWSRWDVYICQINKFIFISAWFSIHLDAAPAPGRRRQYSSAEETAAPHWEALKVEMGCGGVGARGGTGDCTRWNSGPLEQPCPGWVLGIYSAKRVGNFQGLGVLRKKKESRVNSIIFPARVPLLLSLLCPLCVWLSIWSKTETSFRLFLCSGTGM